MPAPELSIIHYCCKTEVALGGKKTSWTFVRSETDGCAGQLSISSAIFLPSIRNVWSSLRTHSSNIWLSIQLFFCDLYLQGKFFMCLKQRGVLDLVITNIGSFSPIVFSAAIEVSLTFLFFSSEHFWPLKWYVLFGKHW